LIAPSMLKCDFGNLQRDVSLLESAKADVLHLDVMDGHFVPNLSYGPMVIERMRELTDLPFDAHLMISDPARYLDDFLNAGCDWVTFHVEAVPEPAPLLRRIRDRGAVAGISLNPGTPVATVLPVLGECDLVLVMSVEPGFGGQSFMPRVLDKVRRIAERRGSGPLISIDGGIGPETIAAAADAGADVFVAGSAIFDTGDYSAAISGLRQRARSHRTDAILEV
jgi:ribulose-phosphate 3-epimerase